MPTRTKHLAWAATGLFAIGAVAGWSGPTLLRSAQASEPVAASTAHPAAGATSAYPSAIPPGTAPNFHAIFADNQAAVVSITTVGETHVAAPQMFGFPFDFGGGEDGNNPFSQFFRMVPPNGGPPADTVQTRALGSGFIVDSDGLILTNAHVVRGADRVTVTLSDHRQYQAKVLGSDRTSDIAVLKIEAHDLPTVHIGDSDKLAVGDYVMAIGAPFGFTESATSGIVSAMSRSLPNDGYVSFIQTDAPVNPGNSGGPLFNASGAVVGINSQIYSNSGGFQGISFAIPINLAMRVESQIVKTGKVEHGRLGIQVQNVDQTLARSFHLRSPEGALVAKVEPESAAAHAGLKAGDVILKYNGASIADAAQLSSQVNTTAPGEHASLEVWRDGKPLQLTVTVGSADELNADAQSGASAQPARLGLAVRPLTPAERDQAGVSHGLVVEGARGPAAEAGIRRGDVVLAIDGTPVDSVAQLRSLVHPKDGQLALLIQRGDSRMFVPVQLG